MSVRAAVLHSVLRPGQETAYETEHRVVPDELLTTLRGHGVRDWVIWRDGTDLLHLVDVDDYAALAAAIADDPANLRWQERMAAHVEGFTELDALPAPRRPHLVWSLRGQVADGATVAS
ncbi:L-rhamnose mutarotase [Nocardioides zeae]|uniref:L-rhamnose mutarotase n=1 Tax=Nocardioides imazamoxiresistens TaxID=3231893 RepID=A0ABU3PTZ2_9ACTN|nr:L-rhamnose mutarotase [Nocardioides zeae]MDT9592275.1 L-rhamnose mutarotase [Nocardioides zeae]